MSDIVNNDIVDASSNNNTPSKSSCKLKDKLDYQSFWPIGISGVCVTSMLYFYDSKSKSTKDNKKFKDKIE